MDLLIFQKINPVKFLDEGIFNWVNQFAGKWPWLDNLGIFFVQYFEYVLIFCLLVFLFVNFKKYWAMVFKAFLAAILARLVIVEIIRYFLPRIRPFVGNHINLLIPYNPSEPSFPSGHAAFYFALSTVIYSYNKKIGWLFFIGSLLIVIARVFVGIHWPSDILAGALIGIFSGWLINIISKKYHK